MQATSKNSDDIKLKKIIGSRRISNYWWASTILIGGIGFFLSGLSSYFHYNLLPFVQTINLAFIPQGILMIFYGTLGITVSLFLWLTILWDVGSGYNEFNKKKGLITIFRFSFPGPNRQILLTYKLANIQSIKVNIKEGINPKREIYLCTKDQREIPLTQVDQPLPLSEIETEAIELASFLGVVVEGL
uniref:photosystem I assembly protein Ycf4 n=1 Tax=Pseudoerythrocladia kornmannii TaxID=753682 RepID=UPI001FCCE743|nr:photosystem I assembly protein Ycf4 [Pseudoerythrocladia kornmannii]UNJ16699.1 photosystem I assembly protein Ycf4 [Pseudoerythrocladia kornmannii]